MKVISSSQKLQARHRIGDVVSAKLVEQVDDRAWIVSLDGMLIQVVFAAPRRLREGEFIPLKVLSLDPPRLICSR